jgi:outer membrane protein N
MRTAALLLLFCLCPASAVASDTPAPAREGEASNENSAPSEEAQDRETGAMEDPLAQVQTERSKEPAERDEKESGLRIYGSARLRYRAADKESAWGDGGSRAGLNGEWQFLPRRWLFARGEAGFSLLDALDQVLNPSGRSGEDDGDLFLRLGYAGYAGPHALAAFGKNWSAWYQVAGFTDHFESTGASASGTYNAGTDGGPTGTGRADRVLQGRFLIDFLPQRFFKPFHLNLQVQHGEPVPQVDGVDYGTAFGASAVMQTKKEYTLGIAYNRADITDEDDPVVRAAGIDGDAEAFIIGTRGFGERWYLATVLSRLKNHETTGAGIYFDGWGWEVFGRYRLYGPIWLTGGWNRLEPDGDEDQVGDYRLRYGVLGLWYSFRTFERLIYLEARFDDSRGADGIRPGNSYAFGVRWDLP